MFNEFNSTNYNIHTYFIVIFILALEWVLVQEKTECSGSESFIGEFPSISGCASQCKMVSSMFAFGTNDYGTERCNNDGCKCLCETSATEEGTCTIVNHNGYRLYKYSKGKRHAFGR